MHEHQTRRFATPPRRARTTAAAVRFQFDKQLVTGATFVCLFVRCDPQENLGVGGLFGNVRNGLSARSPETQSRVYVYDVRGARLSIGRFKYAQNRVTLPDEMSFASVHERPRRSKRSCWSGEATDLQDPVKVEAFGRVSEERDRQEIDERIARQLVHETYSGELNPPNKPYKATSTTISLIYVRAYCIARYFIS